MRDDLASITYWGLALHIVDVVTTVTGPPLAGLSTAVGTWNNYFLPLLVFSKPSLYPLTVGLAVWNSQAVEPAVGLQAVFSLVITGALVSIIPLIVAFIFLQRYWQKGLAFGSVKA